MITPFGENCLVGKLIPARPDRNRDYHFAGLSTVLTCLRAYRWRLLDTWLHLTPVRRGFLPHRPRNCYPPLNFSPYVSYSLYFHLILQLPKYFRYRPERVQQTHKEGSSHAPTRYPARGLRLA